MAAGGITVAPVRLAAAADVHAVPGQCCPVIFILQTGKTPDIDIRRRDGVLHRAVGSADCTVRPGVGCMRTNTYLVIITIPVFIALLSVFPACQSGKRTLDNMYTIEFVDYEHRTPEEILVSLPVYPDSTPSSFMEENSIPREVPAQRTVTLNGEQRYLTASAEYEVNAGMDDIIEWYEEKFRESGFHFEVGYTSGNSFGSVTARGVKYWIPSQPAVSMEIKTYPTGQQSSSVYELLVSEEVRIAQPYNNKLIPSDIECIEIEYTEYTPLTVTDDYIIEGLSGMVNALQVDPGYARFGPLPEPDIIKFTMVFYSTIKEAITVIERNNQIYIEGYPVLWDTHSMLMSKVKEIVQTGE
jgi:hypothetical protein